MPLRIKVWMIGAAAMLGVGFAAGCNIVGPMGYLVGGEEKTPALFNLPADRSVIVFIDDRSSRLPTRALRLKSSQAAEAALLEGKAAPKSDIISSEAIENYLASERSTKQSGIVEVGTAVGAQIVVYATLDSFTLSPNGSEFAPTATARVKVVDVSAKGRIWPKSPEEWHTLTVTSTVRSPAMPSKQGDRIAAEQELAERLGRAVGRLFTKHVAREGSSRIGS
jgi:hypothetical protein